MREGVKSFDRAVWRNARVVVINDCTKLDRLTREDLRQLTGLDIITYEMKYVQVSTDQAFRFRGVVIIVTNLSKSELMSNTGDVALAQRFVEIPFGNIPSTSEINPQLMSFLEDSVPALINWALYVDPQVMRIQAGALNLDSEPSIFALFLMDHCLFDKSSTIRLSDLLTRFSEHLSLYGVSSHEIKTPVKRGIINECAATFGFKITEVRSKKQRALKGLRFLSKNKEEVTEETNFKMSKTYRLDHIDPWSTEERFNLEEFQKNLRSDYSLRSELTSKSENNQVFLLDESTQPRDRSSNQDDKPTAPTDAPTEPESVSTEPELTEPTVSTAPTESVWALDEISSEFQKIVDLSLNDINSPLNKTASLIKSLPQLFKLVLKKQKTIDLLPFIDTVYNPFEPFEGAQKLIQSQETLTKLPELLWIEIVNLFEEILPPATRSWLYDQVSPNMPSFTKTGRSWYSANRKIGIITTLFPQKYKREEFYARIFPTPLDPDKALRLAKTKKQRDESQKCSTITACDRKYKILCVSILNGLMQKEGIKARFVEIDLVSCHARVLCYLFPEKTVLLTKIFEEDFSLWDEIISHIPKDILLIIERKTLPKKLVKIVAYKILQSGLNKPDSILKAIEGFLRDLTDAEKDTVVESLRQNPVLDEFRTLFKEVSYRVNKGNCQVFSMFQESPLIYANFDKNPELKDATREHKNKTFKHGGKTYTGNSFRLCSSILVGVEQLMLCGLATVLFQNQLGVPLCFEHDGCLCLIDESRGEIDLSLLNQRFSELLLERAGIANLKLEIKSLEF